MDEKDIRIGALEALVAKQSAEIVELRAINAELLRRLNQDSSNSSLPPSSDRFRSKPRANKRRRTGRKRGGQPGHKGSCRGMLPPGKVDFIADIFPETCDNCHGSMEKISTGKFHRHQVTDIPKTAPVTIEYRAHEVRCPQCGYKTQAQFERSLSCSSFGPRLSAVVAMLTGVYHLSRRRVVALLRDLFDIKISLGAVSAIESRMSNAVAVPVDDLVQKALESKIKHADETRWLLRGFTQSLWTIATPQVTAFKILSNGKTESLLSVFKRTTGILISDRAKALNFWAMNKRQVCWAHLKRKFISFSEGDGPAGSSGKELVEYTDILFEYWRNFTSRQMSRAQLRAGMAPVRLQIEQVLKRLRSAKIKEVSGSCADILAHQQALWNFIEIPGVEPTNNHAERELRGFVLWRKRSFGSQSERGNYFAERIMTIAHTARKQAVAVLVYLTRALSAHRLQMPAPALIAA